MGNMNRREFLGALGAGLFAAKESLGQEKKEEANKPENKNETYKKILEQTIEAEKKLFDLEKTDFEVAKTRVEETGRNIDSWHSDTFEQASKAELPKNLSENKEEAANELRAFSKQLETLGEKLGSELDTLKKTNPGENAENEKINRGWLGLVSAYNEVAEFMDSNEYKELSEAQHQTVLSSLKNAFPKAGLTEQKFDSVGPTVGKELQGKSVRAVIFVLIAIVIYIAIVFRGMSRVLSPWIMGIAAIIALLHDVIIPMGIFALLGHSAGIEVTAVFVAAVLTILGYSISDTVVVFDRVRENVLRRNSQDNFPTIVHKSIMQTLVRSVNTSATTLLSLVAVYFFGGESVKYFALALIIGIIAGTYSSIFIASPILVWWSGRKKR